MRRIFFYFLFLVLNLSLVGQTTVRIASFGTLKSEIIDGRNITKMIDSVHLIQGNTEIFCDSAYLDKQTNSARAFGNVSILDTVDILDISSDYLEYKGNTRMAYLRNNVIMKDDSTTLYTDNLDFNRNTNIGNYFNGGKLIDSTNVLTSNIGYYNSNSKEAEFYDSVRMVNDDFYLETDSLLYNTVNSRSQTYGTTLGVTADGDTLQSAKGIIYNRQTRYAEIFSGRVFNNEFDIEADTLITNDSLQLYKAFSNIIILSKEDSMTIYGDRAIYDKVNNTALAYENSYMKTLMEGDSLFIKADTLFSDQSDPENKYLSAYHNVQMFKSNMQGIADSMIYNFTDSTIFMYQDPVIWSNDSQITADSINIEIVNDKVERMNLAIKSFVISKDSTENYNQVSGKNMKVFFQNGFVKKTDVNGNGESIYFVKDKSGATSMNKLTCSSMSLFFRGNTVVEIRTYRDVDGQVIPQLEIKESDKILRGFNWRFSEKPKLKNIVRKLRDDR